MTITEMPAHEQLLSEQYRIVAKDFAKAYGRATFMESTRTGTLARMVKEIIATSNEKISQAKAEDEARASEKWFLFNEELAKAKERVEVLRAHKKYIEMQAWERTDANANRRKEMGMSNQ